MIPTLLALLVGASGGSARANDSVKPDATLSNNSVVTPSTAGGKTTYTITGGTARDSGRYLFHSFQAFSLLQNEIGHFDNANSVQTIFGRVTGGNQSNIDGLIKANGTANLYLINPKGIVFGPNARIDLGGAFKASTATALDFNGQLFSAVNPQDAPLLSSDIIPGLQFGSVATNLSNEGVLVVKDGQEILLAGGPLDTVISSGTLGANGGSITLSGGTTRVSGGIIQADGGNISVSGTNSVNISDTSLSALSTTTGGTSTPGFITVTGGDIKIGNATGRTMLRAGNAQVLSENEKNKADFTLLDSVSATSGDGTVAISGNFINITKANVFATDVNISASNTKDDLGETVINESSLNAFFGSVAISGNSINVTKANVFATDVNISASNTKDDLGETVINESSLNAFFGSVAISGNSTKVTKGKITGYGDNISLSATNSLNLSENTTQGFGGYLKLHANDITLDNSQVISSGFVKGKGDAITIDANELNLHSGSALFTQPLSSFESVTGSIRIDAKRGVTLSGENSEGSSSRISRGVEYAPVSIDSGTIAINTSALRIEQGGSISASGSNVQINAKDSVALVGANSKGYKSSITSNVFFEKGKNTGQVDINTSVLRIEDGGVISASAIQSGNSGEIRINASESITLIGSPLGHESSIRSNVIDSMGGSGGGISINTPVLMLQNGGAIDSSSKGTGKAGKIDILARDSVTLAGNAFTGQPSYIASQVLPGSDGNSRGIEIFTPILKLADGAIITTSTSGQGNAGDIAIITQKLALSSGSKIEARTKSSGNAGTINITAPQVVSIDEGSKVVAEASSTGKPGTIEIKSTNLVIGEDAQLSASTKETSNNLGQGGSINLFTSNLDISGKLGIFAETQGQSPAGNLTIRPYSDNPEVDIRFRNNGFISARTESSGQGGNIKIKAPDTIAIRGSGKITAEANGSGTAGDILIEGKNLYLGDNVSVSATTTSAGHAGNINMFAENIQLDESSLLSAKTQGTGDAGTISVNSQNFAITGRSAIEAFTTGSGNGGIVNINSANNVLIDGGSRVVVEAYSTGKPGTIVISTGNLRIGEDAQLSASTKETSSNLSQGGSINLYASNLDISGALGIFAETQGQSPAGSLTLIPYSDNPNLDILFKSKGFISARTESSGQGGNITISAPDTIAIRGSGKITTETSGSGNGGSIQLIGQNLYLAEGVNVGVSTTSTGNAGNINLQANNIQLDQSSRLSAETNGAGKGGSINIKGSSITLDQGAKVSTSSGGTSPQPTGPAGSINISAAGPNSLHLRNGSQISSATSSTIPWFNANDLANILITSPHITLEDGSGINASTSAAAKAGAINLVSPWIELAAGSNITTASTGSGAGGNISINGTRLQLRGASEIRADGGNNGQAGSINLNLLDQLQLNNRSSINASTARSTTNDGGANININLGGNLILNNGSSITASATGKANGGNIKLSLPKGFLLSSFPPSFGGNDILASAEEGIGGRIELRALGIFGVNKNTFDTRISEASAKSRSGRNGVLAFYIPYLTPDRGVVPIEQPLNPDNDLVRVCSPRTAGARAAFTQSGRGGLPILPGTRPSSSPLLDDLGRPALRQGRLISSPLPNSSLPSSSQLAPPFTFPIASATQLQDPGRPQALPLPPCPENR